jgi:hypothetical protein
MYAWFVLLSLLAHCTNGARSSSSPSSWFSNVALRGGQFEFESESKEFEILDETVVYSGWRTMIQRLVRMRNGKVVNFDLVGQKNDAGAVLIFAWDTKTKTATLVREFMPGPNKMLYGLAAGLIEEKHGNDPFVAAQHELEEECHLMGGTWHRLSEPLAMDKYATTKISAYLVIDPKPHPDPKPLDEEEDIEIVSGATIPMLFDWIAKGEMNIIGACCALLAIQKLRELGEYQ